MQQAKKRVGAGMVALAVLGGVLLAGSAPEPTSEAVAWGEAQEGLRIGICRIARGQLGDGSPEFHVVIENTGDVDLALNVGFMLANGKTQYPQAIRLFLADAEGRVRELVPRKPMAIGGRVDPMLIPLPAGACYTVRRTLTDYAVAEPFEPAAQLEAGEYRIHAQYDSEDGFDFEPRDVMSFFSAHHWKGTVKSAPVRFELPAGR